MTQTHLASLGDEVKIWEAASFSLTDQLYSSSDGVKDLCWNHDGTLLASASEGNHGVTVRLVQGGGKRSPISHSFPLTSSCRCVDFATRYLLAACDDGTLHIMDLHTSKLHKSFKGNKLPIAVARWNWNDQNIAFGCEAGQIMVYNVITGQASSPFKPLPSQAISQLKYNPYRKSSLASASEDGVVSFWDTNTRSLVHAFNTEHQAPVSDLAFSPVNDQLMVSTGLDKRLVLYDVQGRKSIKSIVADYPLTSVDMQDGSMVAVGTSRGKILMYDLRMAGVPVVTIPAHKSSIKRICFSKKEVMSPGTAQPRNIAEEINTNNSASESMTIGNQKKSLTLWDDLSTEHSGSAIPSFLKDESSSYLNTDNSSYSHMSPAITGQSQFYSGVHSRSGSSLYSFLKNESAHNSYKSDAEITGDYISKAASYHQGSQVANASQEAAATQSDHLSTPSRQPPQPSKDLYSSGVTFDLLSPQPVSSTDGPKTTVNGHFSPPVAQRFSSSSRTSSTSTVVAVSPPSNSTRSPRSNKTPKKGTTTTTHNIPAVFSPSSSSSSAAAASSSQDIHELLGQMRREMEELKLDVKAVIKAELRQPHGDGQWSGTLQFDEGGGSRLQEQNQPQAFREEYLRKLIRDELEVAMEQSRHDCLDIKADINRTHVQMWWWLNHRFLELNASGLTDQIDRLAEEIARLRRSLR